MLETRHDPHCSRASLLSLELDATDRRRTRNGVLCLWTAIFCTFFSSCSLAPQRTFNPRPPLTTATIPVLKVCNYLIVDAQIENYGMAHFLLDTGSSITVVSDALARKLKKDDKSGIPNIRVRSASGGEVQLTGIELQRLYLGGMAFAHVKAAVRNCDDLSSRLSTRIDGILGFSLFRNLSLTLDYPNSRVVVSSERNSEPTSKSSITFNSDKNIPIIPVLIGDESLGLLIDSGSDAALSVNPDGLHLHYSQPPRPGPPITSLSGDVRPMLGRIKEPLIIGNVRLCSPVVQLTENLSSVGGEILNHFRVTLDQRSNEVTFEESPELISPLVCRSSGLSFARNQEYWRVESVLAGSPADSLGIKAGDVCTEINHEPIPSWDATRFKKLLDSSPKITFTLMEGARARAVDIPVFDLVPVN